MKAFSPVYGSTEVKVGGANVLRIKQMTSHSNGSLTLQGEKNRKRKTNEGKKKDECKWPITSSLPQPSNIVHL